MSFTISELVSFEEEVKKSRFQAFAIPVETEQQIKECLEQFKDVSTTHQCWAWKLGYQVRFNDDGEPSGTAGRPILATIEGNQLTNVLVLVNRWFGGIKLGTGGLVRAYGGCAGKCLTLAEKIELIEKHKIRLNCHFNEWSILQYEFKKQHIDFVEHYLPEGVMVEASVLVSQIEPLSIKLQDLTRGREKIKRLESEHDE